MENLSFQNCKNLTLENLNYSIKNRQKIFERYVSDLKFLKESEIRVKSWILPILKRDWFFLEHRHGNRLIFEEKSSVSGG